MFPMSHSPVRVALLALAVVVALPALSQPRRTRTRRRGPDAGTASAPVVVVPPPSATPELISVPVADIDRMLRQMRVWLFNPPASATGYGLGQLGSGQRLWALLPSCRPPNPDDPRDPCAVDRVVLEAVGSNLGVQSLDPVGLTTAPDARRVQSFVIPSGVARVRIKVMALRAQVRYEAVVDVPRLAELPAPAGSPAGDRFNFDLSGYPAR
jgi:hypothetical protein